MDPEKRPIRVGILTISDQMNLTSSARDGMFDITGRCLRELIDVDNVVESGRVVVYDCVPADKAKIQDKITDWCCQGIVDLLLSTGGVGTGVRGVTPDATDELIQKDTPEITLLMATVFLESTCPDDIIFGGVSGIFEKTLIINLPDTEEFAKDCLKLVAFTIQNVISSIRDEEEMSEQFHDKLSVQVDENTKIPDCVKKIACRHRKSPFPKISMESALSIIEVRSCVEYDVNNKLKLPSVWIFSTGDELVNTNNKHLGSIMDTNTTMIEHIIKQDNYKGQILIGDIVKDNWDDLCKRFKEAFDNADVIVTTGGVSMGEKDLIKPVLIRHFNGQVHFGRVNMKPGMPTTFVTLSYKGKKKYAFCLPGNPVSAGVCTHLFLLPFLRLVSDKQRIINNFKAKLTHSIDELDVRPEYKRALMKYENGEFVVTVLTNNQQSSRLMSFFGSNCLLELPSSIKTAKIEANTIMNVILIKNIENTYIAPVLEEQIWNLTVLNQSNCKNTMNNERMHPELMQSSFISINDVLDLMENMYILKTKDVVTSSALGYVVKLQVNSPENLPAFPASIKDGYAIKYVDSDTWSQKNNIFNVVEVSVAGTAPNHQKEIKEGECVRISTGAPVPPGANCVVQVEDTTVVLKSSDETTEKAIAILKEPKAFDNIRPIGSDISEGQLLLDARTELGPFEIAYLRSVNCNSLSVYECPTIGIIPYNVYSFYESDITMIKNILEVNGFKKKVFIYPKCHNLKDIFKLDEHKNNVDDVIIFCTEENESLSLEKIGDVEVHFHIKYRMTSFGFGALHVNDKRVIFLHVKNSDSHYIYRCIHLFILPFLKFTSGRKQRIPAIAAKSTVAYELPIDSFEKSELFYGEGSFKVDCYTLNYPNCLVKMPLTEVYVSHTVTDVDVIITENSDSYFIHF